MRENKSVLVQAKNVDLALKKAAEQLGVDKESLGYELISQTDAGFLSFLGGRKVEIKVWSNIAVKPPREQREPRERRRDDRGGSRPERSDRHERPSRDDEEIQAVNKEPLEPKELEHLIEDLRSFCSGVCGFIANKTDVAVSATVDEDRLTLDIDDEEIANQIGKNSRLAESMEHILRKKPRYLKRELPFRIFVDAKKIRINRELELVDMARDLSSKVAENQRPIVLNYKSSYDRKIIHMALDKDDRVYTKSIGTGANRKLMILPIKDDTSKNNQQRKG